MPKEPIKGSKKIVVSQAVINQIKKDGMTAALKKSATSQSAAYKEGVKRLYGVKRAAAAVAGTMKTKPATKSATKPASGPDAARSGATTKPSTKSTTKKSNNYGQGGSRTDSAATVKSSTKPTTKTKTPKKPASGPDMARRGY